MKKIKLTTPIYLISKTTSTDNAGDLIESTIERKVFASKESIGQSEFYQAQATGLKPEIKLKIRSREYKGESRLRTSEGVYNIIRTYDKQDGIIELTCSKGVNNATT